MVALCEVKFPGSMVTCFLWAVPSVSKILNCGVALSCQLSLNPPWDLLGEALKGPWRVFPRLLADLEVWPQVAWLAVVQPYLSPLVITVVPAKGGCGGFSKSVQVTHLGYA